ncbi:MAG TPA: SusC/RagA family TonB-linked outer membrane protein [Gemmatimonadales bacterium]|nr:SusC/RagA family TonB-linked outer membrane protein [Gemmatimonadales bacterium]
MRRFALLLALIGLCAVPGLGAAQGRTITGHVFDAVTSAPLSRAQITLKGTETGTLSKDDGSFAVAAPVGDVTLVVHLIGYKRREVVAPAGQENVAIDLERDVLKLEAVIITGQATGQERRNLANAVSSVSADQVSAVPAQDVEQALQGKIAGADIEANSGAPGGGIQVRMRGVTSIIGNSQPLFVMDGVVISNDAIPGGTNAITRAEGPQPIATIEDNPANRLADLNPNDVESIEILPGASASAIYGSKASNGVFIIKTKRGQAGGAPQFELSQGVGVAEISHELGARVFRDSVEVDQTYGAFGSLCNLPGGLCPVYNQEDVVAGSKPILSRTSGSIRGGSETTRYYVSGLWDVEPGIIGNTGYSKHSLRVNVDQLIGSHIDLNFSTNLVHSNARRGLTNNDNTGTSYYMSLFSTPSFVNLHPLADGSYPNNPFAPSNPLQTTALLQNETPVWRFIGSTTMTVNAVKTSRHSLKLIATAGSDFFNQKDLIFAPAELQFEQASGLPGQVILSHTNNLNVNLSGNLVYGYTPASGAFTATTSFGADYQKRDQDIARTSAQNLVGDIGNIGQGTIIAIFEQQQRVRDMGLFAQEEFLGLSERLLLTLGVRADQSSADADPSKLFYYPKAGASYRLVFDSPALQELKLRAAYGQSGNEPLYGQQFTELTSANIGGVPAVGLGLLGAVPTIAAPDLRPEREREIEGGFDATLFKGRATLSVTGYEKRISDLLLQRSLPPSSGFQTEIFNGGVMRDRGLEIALTAVPAQRASFQWTATANFSMDRGRVLSLPVPNFFPPTGFGVDLGSNYIQVGASPTQLVGNDTLCTAFCRVGEQNPNFRVGFANDVQYHAAHLYFLLNWQSGGVADNLTAWLYDLAANSSDYATPITVGGTTVPLGAYRAGTFPAETKIYLQSTTYLKLREVTLSFDIPQEFVRRFWTGGRYARVSLSGRNLFTLTPYKGADPEVSNFGTQQIARNFDVSPYPPSRSFWLSVDFGF